jgi:glycosyltransferase involved in cell wall biosynthesis
MKIGILASDLSGSHGWSSYALNVIRALKQQNIPLVVVCAPHKDNPTDLDIHPLLPATLDGKNLLISMAQVSHQVKALFANCTHVHCMVEVYAPLGAWIANERPYFMTAHGTYIHLPQIRQFPVSLLYRWAFQQAQIICVSHYTQRIAQQNLPNVKTQVVLNAIDSQRFSQIQPQEKHNNKVFTVGGVKGRKGTLELVQVMAKVRQVIPDVQCAIAGKIYDPRYYEKVQQEVERLQLQETVSFLGFISQQTLEDSYAKADMFVLPSMNHGYHFEGFGLVHLEASATGLPVIGTRDCGIEDAIDHEVTGLLVSQQNISEELPNAIIRLLQNPQEAHQMGKMGKYKAQSRGWQDVASELIKLYT